MQLARVAGVVFAMCLGGFGCSSTSTSSPPTPPAGPESPPPPPPPPPGPSYTGPATVGPCASDADCRTLDNCGCHCDPLLRSVRMGPRACEETCPGDGCAGKVARCNPSTRQCEVAPGAAGPSNLAAPS